MNPDLWPVAAITIATILALCTWAVHQHRLLAHQRLQLNAARARQYDTARQRGEWETYALSLEAQLTEMTADRDQHRHDAFAARRIQARARADFLTATAQHETSELHRMLNGEQPALQASAFTTSQMLALTAAPGAD